MTPGELRESRLQRNRSALEDALIKLHEAADLLQPLSVTTGWPGAYPLSDRAGRKSRQVREEVIIQASELRMLLHLLGSELANEDSGARSEQHEKGSEGGGR